MQKHENKFISRNPAVIMWLFRENDVEIRQDMVYNETREVPS
jgi:hypothetical protein